MRNTKERFNNFLTLKFGNSNKKSYISTVIRDEN